MPLYAFSLHMYIYIHSSLDLNPHLRKHHHRSANAGEMLYGLIQHVRDINFSAST